MNKIYQTTNYTFAALLVALFIFLTAINVVAQTSAFTYQGSLTDSSLAANGVYDFQFQLYSTFGNLSGAAINVDDVTVTNGVFTVQLDFGAGAFQQVLLTSRSMEIRVRPGTSTGAYTALAPRQPFTAAPIAIAATKAETATNANFLGNVAASQYVQTNDARLSDSRTPAAGSSSYIQNNATATAQPSTNFNISGNGKIGNTLTTFDALISNDLTVQNDVTIQGAFTGGGSGITGLNASNISTGTISTLRIPSLDATKITTGTFGTALIPNLDASKITTGTIADARLASNVARTNLSNTFTSSQIVTGTLTATTLNATTQINLSGNRFISNSGSGNTFVGLNTGLNNSTGSNNTFIGNTAGSTNTTGSNNTLLGAGASLSVNSLNYATAIGAGAVADDFNQINIGRPLTFGGTNYAPGEDEVIVNGKITVGGRLRFFNLVGGGDAQLCYYSIPGTPTLPTQYTVARCSSRIRYKKDVENFSSGLSLIQRLRPVTFTWKSDNSRDLGFVAEEVNAVEPLMTTYNEKGEVEGVKYDRISAALVNAVNEQQTEITQQKETIERQNELLQKQQQQIDALRELICSANPQVICRPKK